MKSKAIKSVSHLKKVTVVATCDVNESRAAQNSEAKAIYEQRSMALLKMLLRSKADYEEGRYNSVKKAFQNISEQTKGQN